MVTMKRASLSVEWLEPAMIERNWTQEYVAEQMNLLGADIGVKDVQRCIRGENQPHFRHYYRLCKLFGHPLPLGFQMKDTMEDQGEEMQRVTREERQASLVVSPPEREDACMQFRVSDL